MTMTNTDECTSARLLWIQGTPRTKLGDAVHSITMLAHSGCSKLSEVGLNGVNENITERCWTQHTHTS